MMVLKLILFSLFLHLLDDFVLQAAFLNNGKQKEWWRNQTSNELYKNDYIICLLAHGLEWALLTFLPILTLEESSSWFFLLGMIICNAGVHSFVDDMKANKKKINLVTDQVIHVIQILLTYFIWWAI